MNKILEDKLSIIVEDKLLIQALRAVFDERIAKEEPKVTDEYTNELLGQNYKSYTVAKFIVKQAFDDLNNYYKSNKTTPKTNRGV